MSALETQVGGSHYKTMKIQPLEYCHANGIGKIEGDVIAYVSRWRSKNGVEDLKKARHELDILIELEEREIDAHRLYSLEEIDAMIEQMNREEAAGIDHQALNHAHLEPSRRADVGMAEVYQNETIDVNFHVSTSLGELLAADERAEEERVA